MIEKFNDVKAKEEMYSDLIKIFSDELEDLIKEYNTKISSDKLDEIKKEVSEFGVDLSIRITHTEKNISLEQISRSIEYAEKKLEAVKKAKEKFMKENDLTILQDYNPKVNQIEKESLGRL